MARPNLKILDQQEQISLYKAGNKRIRVKRFIIDNPEACEEFEALLLKQADGEVQFIKDPTEIYSQRTDTVSYIVQWIEYR